MLDTIPTVVGVETIEYDTEYESCNWNHGYGEFLNTGRVQVLCKDCRCPSLKRVDTGNVWR